MRGRGLKQNGYILLWWMMAVTDSVCMRAMGDTLIGRERERERERRLTPINRQTLEEFNFIAGLVYYIYVYTICLLHIFTKTSKVLEEGAL